MTIFGDDPPLTLDIHTTFKGQPCVASLLVCHLDSGRTFAKGTDGGGFASIQVPAPGPQGITVAISGAKNSFYIREDGSLLWADENGVSDLHMESAGHYQFTYDAIPNPFKSARQARSGVVTADGRNYCDNEGHFYPLGASLFWALRGLKTDPGRLWHNVEWAAQHQVDYLRVFMHCLWVGNEIDSTWPDYDSLFTTFLETCFTTYGIRIGWTLYGGGVVDWQTLTDKAIYLTRGREQMVQSFEVSNEAFSIGVPFDTMQPVLDRLRDETPNLCAYSSPGGNQDANLMLTPPATWLPLHLGRDYGDGGWKAIRQPWDWKDVQTVQDHDEPIGPDSSVAVEYDPLRQITLRLNGMLCGLKGYTYHSGAGIYGNTDADPHHRPQNLWEEPNADNILGGLRALDQWLPPNLGDGRYYNSQWSDSPLMPTTYWPNQTYGCNRMYINDHGDGTVSAVCFGITEKADIWNRHNIELQLIDPIAGPVETRQIAAGDTFTVTPHSRDDQGRGAYLFQGTYR